jgi:hypothetical protein
VPVSGADRDVPKPGNEVVAPPNRDLGRAGPGSSFLDSCADEGVRLNGSELPVDDCVGRVDGGGPKLNGAEDGF